MKDFAKTHRHVPNDVVALLSGQDVYEAHSKQRGEFEATRANAARMAARTRGGM